MLRVRAAFDIGSSQHKLTVAEISPLAPPRILHQAAIRVPLSDSLTAGNVLPPKIISASHAAVATLWAAAVAHGATHFAAIATQVFRVAENGRHHLSCLAHRFCMVITLLTPMEEGLLAFSTAACHARDLSNVVVWDSGGASSQWTHRDANAYGVHAIPVGSTNVRAAYRRLRRVDKLCEWVRDRAGELSDQSLQRKARSGTVLGIGGSTSMFALARHRTGKPSFCEYDVRLALERLEIEQDVDVISVLPKLVLLAELMRCYGINSVQYLPSNGNCTGLLTCEDNRFWGNLRTLDAASSPPAPKLIPLHQFTSC